MHRMKMNADDTALSSLSTFPLLMNYLQYTNKNPLKVRIVSSHIRNPKLENDHSTERHNKKVYDSLAKRKVFSIKVFLAQR